MPEFLSDLEATEQPLQAFLLGRLRGDENARASLMRIAKALGFQEVLPSGPIGPVVAGALTEHLAEILVKPVPEGPR